MPQSALATNVVTEHPAAPPAAAAAHFERLLALETDCWDVHHVLARRDPGFVLLDVRSPEAYAAGHVPGAISFPHRRIAESTLAAYAPDTLFVVYCSGPHCNGADRAALALSRLGRPVKKMLGGMSGWREVGYEVATG